MTAATRLAAVALPSVGTGTACVVVAFLLPFSQLVTFELGGVLFGQDLIGLVLLPVLLARKDSPFWLRQVRAFYLFAGLWFVGQIATDLIRATPPDDLLRGWSKIVSFVVQFTVLWLLLPRSATNAIAYVIGLGLTFMLKALVVDGFATLDLAVKFGFGTGVTLLLLTAAVLWAGERHRWRTIAGPVALLIGGALALYFNSRSLFGQCVLAAGFTWLVGTVAANRNMARTVTPVTFAFLMLGGLLASQTLIAGYGAAAASGILGEDAREKYEQQAGGSVGLLLGGRTESLVSTVAIADSPVIGHGSWAKDIHYVRMHQQRIRELGLPSYGSTAEGSNELIPAHSYFLGSWVEAGVLGAVFWLWVMTVGMRALYALFHQPARTNAIVVFMTFSLLWDVLFSPFGAQQRFTVAVQLVLLLSLAASVRVAGLSVQAATLRGDQRSDPAAVARRARRARLRALSAATLGR